MSILTSRCPQLRAPRQRWLRLIVSMAIIVAAAAVAAADAPSPRPLQPFIILGHLLSLSMDHNVVVFCGCVPVEQANWRRRPRAVRLGVVQLARPIKRRDKSGQFSQRFVFLCLPLLFGRRQLAECAALARLCASKLLWRPRRPKPKPKLCWLASRRARERERAFSVTLAGRAISKLWRPKADKEQAPATLSKS